MAYPNRLVHEGHPEPLRAHTRTATDAELHNKAGLYSENTSIIVEVSRDELHKSNTAMIRLVLLRRTDLLKPMGATLGKTANVKKPNDSNVPSPAGKFETLHLTWREREQNRCLG